VGIPAKQCSVYDGALLLNGPTPDVHLVTINPFVPKDLFYYTHLLKNFNIWKQAHTSHESFELPLVPSPSSPDQLLPSHSHSGALQAAGT